MSSEPLGKTDSMSSRTTPTPPDQDSNRKVQDNRIDRAIALLRDLIQMGREVHSQ